MLSASSCPKQGHPWGQSRLHIIPDGAPAAAGPRPPGADAGTRGFGVALPGSTGLWAGHRTRLPSQKTLAAVPHAGGWAGAGLLPAARHVMLPRPAGPAQGCARAPQELPSPAPLRPSPAPPSSSFKPAAPRRFICCSSQGMGDCGPTARDTRGTLSCRLSFVSSWDPSGTSEREGSIPMTSPPILFIPLACNRAVKSCSPPPLPNSPLV